MYKVISTQELIDYCKTFEWKRTIKQLHIHHTWKPDHSDYNGHNGPELQQNMKAYHVNTKGWQDIAQHLTLLPDGQWVIGRDFNKIPASIEGWNTGAFCIEMIGNFDTGHDKFEGAQADAAYEFCQFFVRHMRLTIDDLKFHRDNPDAGKTCPGSGIVKEDFCNKVIKFKKNIDTERWKYTALNELAEVGIITDSKQWTEKINEPMPVWAVLAIVNKMYKILKGGN